MSSYKVSVNDQPFNTSLSNDFKAIYDNSQNLFFSGPFGYAYRLALDEFTLNTKNFFVFSYFADQNRINDPNRGQANFNRYFSTPVQKIKKLLDQPEWEDYGVMLFLDITLRNTNIPNTNRDIRNYVSTELFQYPSAQGRIVIYDVVCPGLPICSSQYSVTCVRFASLCMTYVDTAILRDAHSSMPNHITKVDYRHKNYWYNETDKKYWSYQMVNYQPDQTFGRTAMFAATWAGRKKDNPNSIFNLDEWTTMHNGMVVVQAHGYGIDERLLVFLTEKPTFIDDMYIIGVTHLIWLLMNNLPKPQFTGIDKPGISTNYQFESIPSIHHSWNTNYIRIPATGSETGQISELYFGGISCTLKSIIQSLGGNPTIAGLFDYITNSKNKLKNMHRIHWSDGLLDLLPTGAHIWDIIFDMIPINTKVKDYIIMFSGANSLNNGTYEIDLDRKCEINKYYFKGGKLNYFPYLFKPKNSASIQLPPLIKTYED